MMYCRLVVGVNVHTKRGKKCHFAREDSTDDKAREKSTGARFSKSPENFSGAFRVTFSLYL